MNLPFRLRLISGDDDSIFIFLLRIPLYPISWLYSLVMITRNWLYDNGLLRSHKAPMPVISVGNITLGGTGKTPFTVLIASMLRQKGMRVAIVMRGYRSNTAENGNDESRVLSQLGFKVICDPNRVAAVNRLKGEADVVILDDGFQHRRLARDLDIVLVDATRPIMDDRMFPAGFLREPIRGLRRAGCVVLTRADLIGNCAVLNDALCTLAPEALLCSASFCPLKLTDGKGDSVPIELINNAKVLAFCGLGNPIQFFESVKGLGANIVHAQALDDHHNYTLQDMSELETLAIECGADYLVTTAKDWVKCRPVDPNRKYLILHIEARLLYNGEAFNKLVCSKMQPAS